MTKVKQKNPQLDVKAPSGGVHVKFQGIYIITLHLTVWYFETSRVQKQEGKYWLLRINYYLR